MAKNRGKDSLPPNVQAAVDIANQTQEPYDDSRERTHSVKDPGYTIEEDPILAIGDDRVVVLPQEQSPLQGAIEQLAEAASTAADEGDTEGYAPRVEIPPDADPMTRLAASIEKIAARQAGPSPIDPTLALLLGGMMKTMEALVQQQAISNKNNAEALRRGQDPSNPFAPDVNVFNPRGERDHPRPRLKCKMFLPWEAEWESLTREEIQLLNLLEPGDYYVMRNDESRVMVTVRATINVNTGGYDRLLMNSEISLNNDYHILMPPLRKWVRQMLDQRPHTKAAAREVMTMEEEVALIREHGVDFEKVLQLRQQAQQTEAVNT